MGRHAQGWKLRPQGRGPNPIQNVRFTHAKHRWDESTGERDCGRAAVEAARIYAEVISGKRVRAVAKVGGSRLSLIDLTSMWLADFEASHADTGSAAIYKGYTSAWVAFFGDRLGAITTEQVEAFTLTRLAKVVRETVRKERSALRTFIAWCVAKKHVSKTDAPVVGELAKYVAGTRATKRKQKATPISQEQARAFIEALPVMSPRSPRGQQDASFPVQAFFILSWETALRSINLARLEAPRHYVKGQKHLALTDDIDHKAKYGRDLPLSKLARAALDQVVPEEGFIFGRRNYRTHVAAAKLAAKLPASFSPYDLRHGMATHLLALGASLSGVGFVLGHRQATTTNRYLRMSEKEGEKAIGLNDPKHKVKARKVVRNSGAAMKRGGK